MIDVRSLSKHYLVHEKEPGLLGSLRSFVRRRQPCIYKHMVSTVKTALGLVPAKEKRRRDELLWRCARVALA